MKKLLLLLFTFCLAAGHVSRAQDSQISQKADELMQAYTNLGKFSGSVLIAKGGKVLFSKGYGYADVEKKLPNTPQTQFAIASLTKTFTSAVILRLAEQKKLSLNDPLSKFIPDYPESDKIQVRHLLTHTSGVKNYTAMPDYFSDWMNKPFTRLQAIEKFMHVPLAFESGTKMDYSNSNYLLLTYIMEKATGKDAKTLFQQELFKKLNLKNTGILAKGKAVAPMAIGYNLNPENMQWVPGAEMNPDISAGAGFMYSSVEDLYKWDRALYTDKILADATKEMAMTPFKGSYGYGWMITNVNGRTQVGHTGRSPDGYVANFIRFPKEDVCIIYLANFSGTDGRGLADQLTALVFNEPYTIPKKKVEITLAPEVLAQYQGEYELNPEFRIKISLENGKLYATDNRGPQKMKLTAEAQDKFFIKGPDMEIEFTREQGNVAFLVLKMQGLKLKKLN